MGVGKSNTVLLAAGSMGGDLASGVWHVNGITVGSVHCVYTGSPVGTLAIQISNDKGDSGAVPVNWTTMATVAVTAADSYVWNLPAMGYRWVRVIYTRSSGSGVLSVTEQGKG